MHCNQYFNGCDCDRCKAYEKSDQHFMYFSSPIETLRILAKKVS